MCRVSWVLIIYDLRFLSVVFLTGSILTRHNCNVVILNSSVTSLTLGVQRKFRLGNWYYSLASNIDRRRLPHSGSKRALFFGTHLGPPQSHTVANLLGSVSVRSSTLQLFPFRGFRGYREVTRWILFGSHLGPLSAYTVPYLLGSVSVRTKTLQIWLILFFKDFEGTWNYVCVKPQQG